MRISDWSSDVCSSDLEAIKRILHLLDGPHGLTSTIARHIILDEKPIHKTLHGYRPFLPSFHELPARVQLGLSAWQAIANLSTCRPFAIARHDLQSETSAMMQVAIPVARIEQIGS